MKNCSLVITLSLTMCNTLLPQTTKESIGKIVVEDNFMPNLFIRINWLCMEPILINKYMFSFSEFEPEANKEVQRLARQIDRFPTMGPSIDLTLLKNTEFRRSLYFHITKPYGYWKEKIHIDGYYPGVNASDKSLSYFNAELGIAFHIEDKLVQNNKKLFRGEGNSADYTYEESSALKKALTRKIVGIRSGVFYYHRSVAEGSIPDIESGGSNMFVPCLYTGAVLIRQLDRTNKTSCKSDQLKGKRNFLNLFADIIIGIPYISDYTSPNGIRHRVNEYNSIDYTKNYFGYRIGIERSIGIKHGLNLKFVYIRKPGLKKLADNYSTFEITVGTCFNRVIEKYATRKKYDS